jgi:hypothetical protein
MRRRRLLLSSVLLTVSLGITEVVLRWAWGFGSPVLYEWDGRFEYRMVPGQRVMRFGKLIETDSRGLRGPELPTQQTDQAELRILVVGDSVVNGGSHVDQSRLGTVLLQEFLDERLTQPVVVVNVSANSWGPANQVEFLKAFGTFDADIAIVVASSHDLVDVPVHSAQARANSGNTFNAPWSALTEVAGLAWARLAPSGDAAPPDENDTKLAAECLTSFEELLSFLNANTKKVAVAMHWDRNEQAANATRPAHATLVEAATQAGAAIWELGPAFIAAEANPEKVLLGSPRGSLIAVPTHVMHDRIHPTEFGQLVLARELLNRLENSGWYADVTAPGP